MQLLIAVCCLYNLLDRLKLKECCLLSMTLDVGSDRIEGGLFNATETMIGKTAIIIDIGSRSAVLH